MGVIPNQHGDRFRSELNRSAHGRIISKRANNIGGPEGEPRLEGRREARERIDDRQDPDLAPRGELVVYEVHRPRLVRLDRRTTTLPQLRLHAPLGRLVAQLQAQLLVALIYRVHDEPSLEKLRGLGEVLASVGIKMTAKASFAISPAARPQQRCGRLTSTARANPKAVSGQKLHHEMGHDHSRG